MKKMIRKTFKLGSLICLAVLAISLGCYLLIEQYAARYVHQSIHSLPDNKVGIVLGTSARLRNGQTNLYFHYRMKAAAELYHSGKVKYLLVSGDNGTKAYNEPRAMRKALIKLGVPDSVIYADYAGFRTLDSVVRCYKVFGQSSFTVISQDFHTKRAIYIAREKGINAVGYTARDVSTTAGIKVKLREMLARVKAILDVNILNIEPRFLGEEITIS